jgi:cyclin-dependent kinase
MANGRPLFAGTSEADQLDRIFRHLGTPNESNYPLIRDLPEYKTDFPVYERPESPAGLVPTMDAVGVELFSVFENLKSFVLF